MNLFIVFYLFIFVLECFEKRVLFFFVCFWGKEDINKKLKVLFWKVYKFFLVYMKVLNVLMLVN